MQSADPRCQKLKDAYDECFNKWFQEKFLKGHKKDLCAPLLKSYRECINEVVKEKGIVLWELDRDVLGTKDEAVPPKSKTKDHNLTSGKS